MKPANNKSLMWGILAAITVGLIIIGVMVWAKSSNNNQNNSGSLSPTASAGNQYGPPPPSGGDSGGNFSCSQGNSCSGPQGHPPVTGKVTAVSATSITVQPTDGSSAKTYSIDSSTQELNGPNQAGTAYKDGDVKVGDNVGVGVNFSDSSKADVIMPNYKTETLSN